MKNRTTLVGIASFSICLWLVVVTTYAAQTQRETDGLKPKTFAEGSSCSSSATSGEE